MTLEQHTRQERAREREAYFRALEDAKFAKLDKQIRALVVKGNSPELKELLKERGKMFSKFYTPKTFVPDEAKEQGALANFKHKEFTPELLKIFKDESIRKEYERIFGSLCKYCEKFPSVAKPNIVLFGKTGTGKTFTAKVMAKNLKCKGFDVVFKSAFELVQVFKDYIWNDDRQLQKLMSCDLLVIDDLGSEPVLRNITEEYLYNIINHRLEYRLPFVITTNLNQELLLERYGQAIAGRILNREKSIVGEMDCEDLRG